MSAPAGSREDQLVGALATVRERIARACAQAGRPVDAVTLIVVTKTHPAQDVRILAGLGVTDVGENRDQEASAKHEACPDLPLRWHFVGQLQTNKARSVARYADVVHSVDRERLATALSRGAVAGGRTLRALVQVALDGSPGTIGPRGGAHPADVPSVAAAVVAAEGLVLGGVMAVAPPGLDPAGTERAFASLMDVAGRLRRDHPDATDVSAGMSGDLEAAVRAGATHVRVGTAVLGSRPDLQ